MRQVMIQCPTTQDLVPTGLETSSLEKLDQSGYLLIDCLECGHRIERRRRDSAAMLAFRDRARSILDELASEVKSQPDLRASLAEARRELDEDG